MVYNTQCNVVYIAENSAHHLQLKCMGGLFFLCHPYIESTTVLSDIKNNLKNIFNKNDRICRDVKTQKVWLGWVTAGTKLNKPLPYICNCTYVHTCS